MKALIALALVLAATPALAQTAKKYTKASQPPPGYTCGDFYRSRDYGSLFANLYESNQPTAAQPIYCGGEAAPSPFPQPKERR